MSISLIAQYPTQADPVSAQWPLGEPRNITAPGDGRGTPWEAALVKDIVGLQQALLTSGGIVPSGTPDQVTASQYLQALIELVSGRAVNYDESGVANAYVVDARTGLQGVASLFVDMIVKFTPGNDNTGVSTVNVTGLGVKNIIDDISGNALVGGELLTTREATLKYDGTAFRLLYKTVPFVGRVSSTGVGFAFPNGWMVAKISTGVYRITHGLALVNPTFDMIVVAGSYQLTGGSNAGLKTHTSDYLANTFDVTTWNTISDSLTDSAFTFHATALVL